MMFNRKNARKVKDKGMLFSNRVGRDVIQISSNTNKELGVAKLKKESPFFSKNVFDKKVFR